MRKKFTMLLASLFLCVGAWAQTAATYADGLYKIYWEPDQRGYLTYHADYPESPQLAGVVNHNPNGHYQLTDDGINLGWYLYTSPETSKSYLFEATTGKFVTIKLSETVGNGKACILSEAVSVESQLNLMQADGGYAGYLFRYVVADENYHFCSGCGSNKGNNPVRFSSDAQSDGGNRFVFVKDDALTITDEVKNAAIAKIVALENPEADIYAVHANAQGTRNSSDRKVKTISLASNLSASNAANATTLTHDGNGLKYIDMTETVTMKAYANEPVTAAVSLYGGHWIHAYVYIDLGEDGFSAGVADNGYTPTGDLMSYSCYSQNTTTWYNKDGQVANNNTLVMPQFMAPAAPGTYRMRFKTDWNNIMPDGSADESVQSDNNNQFVSANGTIVDVTLVVEEAPTNYTVKYDFVYKGEVKYSQENLMQLVGDEYPAITVTHPYGVVSAAKPTGVVDGSDAVGSVITKQIELTVQGLPFEFSDSYANAVWYYMPLHATGKYYLGYVANQTSITLSDAQKVLPAEGHDAYLWAFVGDPFTGYKIMNKAAGDGKILSSSETMSGNNGDTTYPLMIDGTSVPDGNNTYWIPSVSNDATNGFYLEQKGKSSNKMNRRGDNLAYWSGGADGGSTFRVTTLATAEDVLQATLLINYAGKVGYPKEGIAVENELLVLTDGRATMLDVAVAVSNYKKSTNIALPEDGKAYKIYNYSHYDANGDGVGTTRYLNYTEGQALSVKEDANEASVFVCKKLSDGTYTFVTEDGKVLTWMNSGEGYKENDKFNGYSSNYAIEYSNYSDWNRITVKKNGNTEDDFGHLRLVARRYARDNEAYSSFIIQGDAGTWDKAGDSYFLQKPEVDSRCFSSAWILSEVEHTNTDAENLAIAKIDALGVRYGLLAEGIGGYHYMLNGAENYSWATVRDAVYAMSSVADVENVTFGINQPAAGFYRIKSMNGNDENKKGKNLLVSDGALALNNAEGAASIMYIDAAKGILNYGSGLYINTWNAPAEVGAQAVGWNFIENAKVAGTYALEYNDNAGGQMDYYLADWTGNVTYGQNDANAAWIFEEVTKLPVAVSAAGYATLYAPVALTIPTEDVTVYTATVDGTTLNLNPLTGTIPANTGVIIEAAQGTYNFAVAADGDPISGNNALTGKYAKSVKNPVAKVYTLQMPNKDDKNSVGFYLFKGYKDESDPEGTKTYINGFRAWVELPADSNVQALRFTRGDDEDTTGIEGVEANEELVIFDLAGRRVQKMEKGIYIVNGKKVVVK